MDHVAKIDRVTDHLRNEMARLTAHRAALIQNQQLDDVPLHDAMVEQALRATELPAIMTMIERQRQEHLMSPEIERAWDRLERECKAAAALFSSIGVSSQ